MRIRELAVKGALEIAPEQFTDHRGSFLEWFRHDIFRETVGHPLVLAQANCSVSAAGVIRGIHYADVPPGQAKYVACVHGAILDVVVDLRVGSPTFGSWEAVCLDDDNRRAVYLGEGLGHAFMALQDQSTVVYLCSSQYNPAAEHGVHPLDTDLAIDWPTSDRSGTPIEPVLSAKDETAPTFRAARDAGDLPQASAVRDHVHRLEGPAKQD